jgi:alpha-tubulin suppressor-like RCC1 family protein
MTVEQLKSNGTLWAWGLADNGRLGNNQKTDPALTPTQIGADTDWAYAETDNDFSLGIKTNGTVWSWGNNSYFGSIYGQLGDSTITERLIPGQISGL